MAQAEVLTETQNQTKKKKPSSATRFSASC